MAVADYLPVGTCPWRAVGRYLSAGGYLPGRPRSAVRYGVRTHENGGPDSGGYRDRPRAQRDVGGEPSAAL